MLRICMNYKLTPWLFQHKYMIRNILLLLSNVISNKKFYIRTYLYFLNYVYNVLHVRIITMTKAINFYCFLIRDQITFINTATFSGISWVWIKLKGKSSLYFTSFIYAPKGPSNHIFSGNFVYDTRRFNIAYRTMTSNI